MAAGKRVKKNMTKNTGTVVFSIAFVELLRLLNPFVILYSLWSYRDLIGQLIKREVGQRYRGSYLGVLWSFITPFLMLMIYTFVFSMIFKSSWQAGTETPIGEFALTLFAGLAAFNLFSEVVNRAPTLILTVPNYVKKVVFPVEILPVVAVGSALVNSLIASGLVIAGSILLRGRLSPTIFILPLSYLPLCFLSLGLGWFLSSLGVYIRDIGQGINIFVQMLFFLSPVFYPTSAIPETFQDVISINPLTLILTEFRQTLLWGEMIDLKAWGLWFTLTFVLAILGYVWFTKTKKGFADVM